MLKKADLSLSEALLEKGLIERSRLEPLLKEADASGTGLEEELIRRGLFKERELLLLLGRSSGFPTRICIVSP